MMDSKDQKPAPFNSSKFVADWAIRQAKQSQGTWYGMSTNMIPSYTHLIP